MRQWRLLLLLTSMVATCGSACGLGSTTPPESDQARFELTTDSKGRTLRFDRKTGEVAVLEGSRFVPVRGGASKGVKPQTPGQVSETPAVSSRDSTPPSTPAVSTRDSAPTVEAASVHIGSLVDLRGPAPVYLLPDAHRTPIVVAAQGSNVKVLSAEPGWYRVQFSDSRSESRVGYVEARFVGANAAGAQPPVGLGNTGSMSPQPTQRLAPPVETNSVPLAGGQPPAQFARVTGEDRVRGSIIGRQDHQTEYSFSVPGRWHSTGTERSSPPTEVSYQVRGATLSLQLSDGRVVVANCDRKLAVGAARSCRVPMVKDLIVELSGSNARLLWSVSINGSKLQEETYKILAVLQK